MAAEELDKLTVITDLSNQGKSVWRREMILKVWAEWLGISAVSH